VIGEVVVGEVEEVERGGGHDVFGDYTTAPPDTLSDGSRDYARESVVAPCVTVPLIFP
jgi:hypothetical protein